MISAILLAAGQSQRMKGQNKLLKNTLDYQEILHDLTEISKVGHNYDINDTDDIDKYYHDISTYVLSAVSHIYLVSKEDSIHND